MDKFDALDMLMVLQGQLDALLELNRGDDLPFPSVKEALINAQREMENVWQREAEKLNGKEYQHLAELVYERHGWTLGGQADDDDEGVQTASEAADIINATGA